MLFFPSYSPPSCQHQMLIIGRGETVSNLAIELDSVDPHAPVEEGCTNQRQETPPLDINLRVEYFER